MNEVKKGRYEVAAYVIEMLAKEGYTMEDFAQIVRELGEQKGLIIPNNVTDIDSYQRVTKIIKEMGIPSHTSGYHYLRRAICETIEDFSVVKSMMRVLYPIVARKFDTTPENVERDMRNAIKTAWYRKNNELIHKCFGDEKPANNEFIATIADIVRRDK